jgi:Icc protein
MLIAQISDTHILAKTSDRPEAEPRADDLRRCVADINGLDPLPDVVIHSGDTVQTGAEAEYRNLAALLAPLRAPVYLIPGNRDHHDNLKATFDNTGDGHPFLHYVIDEFPVRVIALDSIEPGERKGAFCAERLRWLDETLSQSPDRATILFMHHPPFDVGPRYIDGYRNLADRNALAAIVIRHRQVRRLMCGHCHRSSQRLWAGTVASTMASVARDVREGIDTERHDDTPLYQLHAIADDGYVTTQTRLVTG